MGPRPRIWWLKGSVLGQLAQHLPARGRWGQPPVTPYLFAEAAAPLLVANLIPRIYMNVRASWIIVAVVPGAAARRHRGDCRPLASNLVLVAWTSHTAERSAGTLGLFPLPTRENVSLFSRHTTARRVTTELLLSLAETQG